MTKMRTRFSIAVFAAAILLATFESVPRLSAQDQYPPQGQNDANDQDPPAIAGRLGYVEGSVSFQPGGQGDWIQATANRPLTVGDNLWVDQNARAEVQIGSTSIRLGPETSLTFSDVENNVTQLRLSMGSVYFSVRRYGGDDTFEVDTPNLAFNVNRPGQFRVNVNENGDQTVATVWRGEAEITGSGNSYRLSDGQQGTFSGTEQLTYDVTEIGAPDDFDRWAMDRDARWDRADHRYVSEEMTGYEDLGEYGHWREVAGYGNVWSPDGVPGDWAPYRYGEWTWVNPWGWSWVEQEPWGFAPFHYGRWAYAGNSWCWVPGPVQAYPVYSPALVAFVGGGGFSFGAGVGAGVGWFPLGPGEVFVPWYRTSPRYVQNVNITNTRVDVTRVTTVYNNVTVNHVTNITYVNQRVNNSVTVVNHDTFVGGRSVHNNLVKVDARQIASAPVTHDFARNTQPTRESMIGASKTVQVKAPQQVLSRPVVATRQPTQMAYNRGPEGVGRPAAPPPVKTVKPAPPAQAQALQKGARGSGGGPANAERPGTPANNRPENMGNNPARPGPAENNRPNPENNRTVPRPNAPENNRPGAAPQNEAPRPGAPENRPNPENRPGQPENRPGAVQNQPGAGPNQEVPRPGNRPEATPEQPRENPNARPEPSRPNETPGTKPEQTARPPEGRQETAPRQNGPEAAPKPDRNEAAPRPEQRQPEQRQAEPPSRNENRGQAQRNEPQQRNEKRSEDKNNSDKNNNKEKEKENKPPQYR